MVSVNGDCQRPTPQQCGSKRAHKGVARGAVKQAYLKEGLLVAQCSSLVAMLCAHPVLYAPCVWRVRGSQRCCCFVFGGKARLAVRR